MPSSQYSAPSEHDCPLTYSKVFIQPVANAVGRLLVCCYHTPLGWQTPVPTSGELGTFHTLRLSVSGPLSPVNILLKCPQRYIDALLYEHGANFTIGESFTLQGHNRWQQAFNCFKRTSGAGRATLTLFVQERFNLIKVSHRSACLWLWCGSNHQCVRSNHRSHPRSTAITTVYASKLTIPSTRRLMKYSVQSSFLFLTHYAPSMHSSGQAIVFRHEISILVLATRWPS